jgi:class 3 adenylate cyclase/tetratricopeptide (TPR) repeat protein
MLTCSRCGRESPEDFGFCPGCGAALTVVAPAVEVRRTVTIVFCDVTGSTALGEQLDPESLRDVQSRFFDAMRTAIERHGGTVEKYIGDAVMAVFGIPTLHEDDALRAARAAADMRDSLAVINEHLELEHRVVLQVRIGVNTGEVVSGDQTLGQALVTGDAVNVAARLEQAAAPGEILMGKATHRLVRGAVSADPVEPLSVKGKADRLEAFRLRAVHPTPDQPAPRMGSPMVGRESERALLRWAFDRAVEDRSCQLATVLGAAGVGKSRLVFEFLKDVGPGCIALRGRCLPYGEGITFRPVAEVVRQAVGAVESTAPEDTRARVAAALGPERDADAVADRLDQVFGWSGPVASPEETFWAVRKLLEALARDAPVVVVFDDIHWGEPTFLDLIEHVADWSRDAPILLLCMARPELLDRRAGWAGGKLNATTTLLEPLSSSECEILIENLLGRTELVGDVRSRIADAADGNPLFVEEMIAMLIDEGHLRRQGRGWIPTRELSDVAVPPTIQALLAARLDLLSPPQRAVLERGSVEGKVFHRGGVLELTPPEERAELSTHLMTLVRKELIRPERTEFAGDDAFRFRHLLIRDAAYQSMSKSVRAELHERLAGWLDRVSSDRPTEYEEIIGYHFEQSHRFRAELGPLDEHGVELGRRAADRLGAAGRRAVGRGDVRAAVNLLGRTVALLPVGDSSAARALPDLGAALDLAGDLNRSESVFGDAIEAGRAAGDRQVELRATIGRSFLRMRTDPEGSTAEAQVAVETALPVFESVGDDLGLSEAWRLRALIEHMFARAGATEGALERAIHHARRADAVGQLGELFAALLSDVSLRGPLPVGVDIERTEKVIHEMGKHRRIYLAAQIHLGVLRAMLGDFDGARTLLDRAESVRLDLGLAPSPYLLLGRAGYFVEMLAGDPVTAERFIRKEYEALERMGERTVRSTDAGYLAQALIALGRPEEAERFARICREAAASEDLASQILWRSVQAKVQGRREPDPAIALGREAVEISRSTDYVVMQADALMDLVEVLMLSEEVADTIPLVDEAIGLYEAKGIVPATERARLVRSGSMT